METNFSKTKQKYSYNGILDANHFLMAENAALKESNEVLLDALKKCGNILNFVINGTPTGDNRNMLTEANIYASEAITKSEATKA